MAHGMSLRIIIVISIPDLTFSLGIGRVHVMRMAMAMVVAVATGAAAAAGPASLAKSKTTLSSCFAVGPNVGCKIKPPPYIFSMIVYGSRGGSFSLHEIEKNSSRSPMVMCLPPTRRTPATRPRHRN